MRSLMIAPSDAGARAATASPCGSACFSKRCAGSARSISSSRRWPAAPTRRRRCRARSASSRASCRRRAASTPISALIARAARSRRTAAGDSPIRAQLAGGAAVAAGPRRLRRRCAGRDYDLVHVGRAYLAHAGLAVAGARRRCRSTSTRTTSPRGARQAARRRRRGEFAAAALLEAEGAALEREMRRDSAAFRPAVRQQRRRGGDAAALRARRRRSPSRQMQRCARPFPLRATTAVTVVFVGGLGYWPNAEGSPGCSIGCGRASSRGARGRRELWIVGGGVTPAIRRLARRRRACGCSARSPISAPIYRRATLAVAPLHCGGGTRIKIIEAGLAGVAVVATRFGAAGLPLRDGCDLWLADALRTSPGGRSPRSPMRAERAAARRVGATAAGRPIRSEGGSSNGSACQLSGAALTNPAA